MVRRCHFCGGEFGDNTVIESYAGARRVAYDPIRGRLWSVCPHCGRWSLAPIDSRWEVLESLEQVTRGSARMLGKTDNIELFTAGDAQIVRVGHAGLREEAWWRYVRDVADRRRKARTIVQWGRVREAVGTFLMFGLPMWGFRSAETWLHRARKKQFGRELWSGHAVCGRCGRTDHAVRFDAPIFVATDPADPDALTLGAYCRRCGQRDGAHIVLPTRVSEHVLRKRLAWNNFAGVPDPVLDGAVRSIEAETSAAGFVRRLAIAGCRIDQLPPLSSIAFEIAINEKREQRLLSLELDELDARWREEEEIAAIVDGELT